MFVCVLWPHTFLAARASRVDVVVLPHYRQSTITIITIILKCSLWSTVLPWSCGPALPGRWERRESLTCLSHIPRYSSPPQPRPAKPNITTAQYPSDWGEINTNQQHNQSVSVSASDTTRHHNSSVFPTFLSRPSRFGATE